LKCASERDASIYPSFFNSISKSRKNNDFSTANVAKKLDHYILPIH
jgi:hypothetical protein